MLDRYLGEVGKKGFIFFFEESVIMAKTEKVVLFLSGGNGGATQSFVRIFFLLVKALAKETGRPLVPYGARGGFSSHKEPCENWIFELTDENTAEQGSPYDPGLITYGTAGPDGEVEQWKPLIKKLHKWGAVAALTRGGNYSLWSLSKCTQAIKELGLKNEFFYLGIPKSIDNDYPGLAAGATTLGSVPVAIAAAKIALDLCSDARSSDSYISMLEVGGNAVGWLAQRTAKEARMPYYLIPEQFPERVPLSTMRDIIIGAYLKGALSVGRRHLVPIIAEGIAKKIIPETCPELQEAIADAKGERDGFHPKNFAIGNVLKKAVDKGLEKINFDDFIPKPPKVRVQSARYSPRGARADKIELEKISELIELGLAHMIKDRNSGFFVRENGTFACLVEASNNVKRNVHEDVRYLDTTDAKFRSVWNSGRGIRLVSKDMNGERFSHLENRTMLEAFSHNLNISPKETKIRFAPVVKWGEQFSN